MSVSLYGSGLAAGKNAKAHFVLMALSLFTGYAHAAAVKCPDLSGEAMEGETKIATAVGLAVMYPTYAPSGVEVAVECMIRKLEETGAALPGQSANLGMALIIIMTIDPQRFFRSLEKMPASAIERWLHGSYRLAEIEYIGSCSAPDRFQQASKAISGLALSSERQRQLRDEILEVLNRTRCRYVG